MSGGRAPKRNGVRAKQALVRLLCELGLPCARVPLSGAIGGAWPGDIQLELRSSTLKIEVKARREFRTPHHRLAGVDPVPLKGDHQQPLAVLPIALLAELIES
jgi:hypothetical protein